MDGPHSVVPEPQARATVRRRTYQTHQWQDSGKAPVPNKSILETSLIGRSTRPESAPSYCSRWATSQAGDWARICRAFRRPFRRTFERGAVPLERTAPRRDSRLRTRRRRRRWTRTRRTRKSSRRRCSSGRSTARRRERSSATTTKPPRM